MQEHMKEAADAYQQEVTLKLVVEKMYGKLSDQVQDIIIEKVEQETLLEGFQVAFQAETTNSESWRRISQILEQQYVEKMCKIPKFLRPIKYFYQTSSPDSFSRHTNEI